MRLINVKKLDKLYATLLKSDGPNRYKPLTDADLKTAPPHAYIVTGDKPDFGGGASPDGFLMNGDTMLGRLRIQGRVNGGVITIP